MRFLLFLIICTYSFAQSVEITSPTTSSFSSLVVSIYGSAQSVETTSSLSYRIYHSPNGGAAHGVAEELRRTTSTADIAIYSINEAEIVGELISAAHRGVRIRIVADLLQSRSKYSAVNKLIEAGIPVHVQRGSGNGYMHLKLCVLDHRTVGFGSMNWTFSGDRRNDEVYIFFYRDPFLVLQNQTKFDALWSGMNAKNIARVRRKNRGVRERN